MLKCSRESREILYIYSIYTILMIVLGGIKQELMRKTKNSFIVVIVFV